MGGINWGRVFLGGLLCALVDVGLGATLGSLLWRAEILAAIKTLGRPLPTPELVATLFASISVLGVLTIWLYAAVRPRYGPGPRTAAIAGFALWLVASVVDAFWVSVGVLPLRLTAKLVGAHLVIRVAAAVVGAWPYKE